MSKKLLLLIPIFLFILTLFGFLLFSSYSPTLNAQKSDLETSEMAGEMEFLKDDGESIKFITYRTTAVAEINKESKEFKTLSEQILPQELIENLYWNKDKKQILLEIFNEPFVLEGNSNYKKSQKEHVYATYSLGDKQINFLPEMEKAWIYENIILGLDNEKNIFKLGQNKWEKTSVKLQSDPIISLGNGAFADIKDQLVTVYNKDLLAEHKVKVINKNPKFIRLFDDGTVSEITNKNINIYKKDKISFPITKEEQQLFGENVLIFSSKDKNFIYFPLKNKKYELKGLPKDIVFPNLYGLNDKSAIYTDGTSETATLFEWR